MLSDEVIDKVVDRLVNRIEQANEYVIRKIGENIKKIGTVTPSKAQELAQILKYGGDYNKIIKKLAEITKLNVKDIRKIFHEVAKNDYQFAEQFYKYRNVEYIPYKDNMALQNQIEALSNIAERDYINLTRTTAIGFGTADRDGGIVYKGLQQAYYDLLDEAVISVQQGKETFQEAMYRQIKEMGGGGLKVIYPTTYIGKDSNGQPVIKNRTMRLDSAVRMQMQGALRDLHNENQRIFGEQFDADMIEISVHLHPALDHLMQGRQFLIEEFEKLQNGEQARDLKNITWTLDHDNNGSYRPISTLNCYHYVFYGIAGVSEPEYSDEELQKIIKDNNDGFEFENKHYTLYEGEQLLRKIELELRKSKDMQIMGRESGNIEAISKAQARITQLTHKYRDILKASGLRSRLERAKVSNYRRINIDKIK